MLIDGHTAGDTLDVDEYAGSDRTSARGGVSIGRAAALVGTAALLAGAAAFNVARARRAEQDYPPQGKFVEIDGVRLHYVERGSGRPLVLLHGNGASVGDMEASGLLDRAAGKYHVIAFDRPGYGHSSRPRSTIWTPEAQASLLWKALRGMGISRPIIVGHSWGTMVALAMALDHTDDVAALVLLSGYFFPTVRSDTALFAPPAIPVVGDLMRFTVSPVMARLLAPTFVRRIFAPAPVPASFERFPLPLSLRPSQIRAAAAEAALMQVGARQLSKRYDELQMPIVIMTGDGDKIVSMEAHSRALHEQLPGSRLIVVPGAGHMIHYLATDEVLDAIDHAAGSSASIEAEADDAAFNAPSAAFSSGAVRSDKAPNDQIAAVQQQPPPSSDDDTIAERGQRPGKGSGSATGSGAGAGGGGGVEDYDQDPQGGGGKIEPGKVQRPGVGGDAPVGGSH
jgi:pimeloyl-ACP methyl ester carboxylesterase